MRKILITERQKNHLKAIAAQDQVGGKVNAGIMGAVTGMMCEEFGEGVEKWYRGYDSRYNTELGVPEGGGIWLTDEYDYALEYAKQPKYEGFGRVAEVMVDMSKVNAIGEADMYDMGVDPYSSYPEVLQFVKSQEEDGQPCNAWECHYYDDDAYGLCLCDSSPIVSYHDVWSPQMSINEEKDIAQVITLYHGVMAKNLEFNIKNGGFVPRVCSEGGPSAVWLSQKMYGYQFTFKFNIPVNLVDQMTNVDYIYEGKIPFDYFDCELVRTAILVHYDGICVEVNLLNKNMLSNQFRMLPELPEKIKEMFADFPAVYEKFVAPYMNLEERLSEDVDTEKFEIGFEPGGVEPYGHIVQEMNDRFNGETFSKNSGTVTFITFVDKPKVYYSNENGMTHGKLTKRLMDVGEIPTYEFSDKTNIRADVYQTGRFWVGQNTISFWSTPALKGNRDKLRNVVEQLGLDKNTLDIDFWDTRKEIGAQSPFLVPYKWFVNGTFDDLMAMGAYSITRRQNGTYHVLYGDFKHTMLDRDGNVVNDMLRESREWCESFDYKPYLKSLAKFLQDNGINVNPLPKVVLHHKEQEGLYIRTGYYDPENKEVHLFVCDRHPKDVLRSFTHEMIHHSQNLRGILVGYKGDTLDGDEVLDKLESEAYLKGNIYFRRWTEELHPEVPGKKKEKLNESFQDVLNMVEDEDIDFGVGSIISEFFNDRSRGITRKRWRTIPAQQYANLLERYMREPMMARIPEDVVTDWFINIIVTNSYAIRAITELAGHDTGFEYDEVQKELDIWMPGKYTKKIVDFDSGFDALNNEGFFEWCCLPDGSDGWSDYGLKPIFNELSQYKPGMPAGDLLILINRILHIGHCRGDLASAFIEGGSSSCSAISGIIRESKWNGNGEEYPGLQLVQNPPAKFYHVSDQRNRKSIMSMGLFPDCGEEYAEWWNYEGPNGEEPDMEELPQLVFMTARPFDWYNSLNDGNYDIYEIDTAQLDKNQIYYDPDRYQRNKGSYCYGDIIPPSALKLYTGGPNINENFDIAELSTPDSIDLSSFDIKDQLNPRFWKDGRLDSRVRIALLDIADDFIETLDVKWVEPKDIIMTGSLANFNWSKKHSDVDLHIVMDFSEVDKNVQLVKDYFDSKRRIWNDTHENLTIAGYPVELYVQDESEPHASSGVYSLERDKWIVEPSHDDMEIEYDEDVVRKKVSDYIDELEEEYEDNVADCDLSELHDKVINVFRRIKDERKNGFDNGGGEYNTGNIIFKALRRNGYIAKVDKLRTDTYDSMKSLLNENAFENQK